MTVRPETPDDHAAIERIHVEAFANHPYSHQTEHLIVNALRAAGVLTVSLVAEMDGEVVGHIAFSPGKLDSRDCPWFVLGPIGVLPRCQRRGIGKALIQEGLKAIQALGADGCILVGNPAYYTPLGFASNPALTMEHVPTENLMYLALGPRVPSGQVEHHPAFWVTD